MKVFKYKIEKYQNEYGVYQFDIPSPMQVLHVDVQDGIPTLWCLVDDESPIVTTKKFHVVGTGKPIEFNTGLADHVGTFREGPYVWHLFMENL